MLGHGVAAALVCLRSTPPRVGAVLLTEDGEISYTDCAPPVELLAQFKPRNDNQIASLEMLAIAYGMGCTPGGVCACVGLCFSLVRLVDVQRQVARA
jgi:hypothetical protein